MIIGVCEKCNKSLKIISSTPIFNLSEGPYASERFRMLGMCRKCGATYTWIREYRFGHFVEYENKKFGDIKK